MFFSENLIKTKVEYLFLLIRLFQTFSKKKSKVMNSFQGASVSNDIPHTKFEDEHSIEMGKPPAIIAMSDVLPADVHRGCFKCGRCLRTCCTTEGSFCASNLGCKNCYCTTLSTVEATGFISAIMAMVTAVLGVCCMGCCSDQCCHRPNGQSMTCNFCGWIIPAWQGILFVATWFGGLMLFLVSCMITIRLSKKYGTSCCRGCGCTSCARGFEDSPV